MKRLIAFVLLLGAGFYLLYELVGEDMIVTAGTPDDNGAPNEPARSPNRGSGVGVTQGPFGATVEQRGELLFPQSREIKRPDGSVVKEDVFVLHAADSQPLRDGLQQLDDVEVTLFENGEPAAKIFAVQALVELGRDANGDPSLAANKEISMIDVVFEALPGSRLEGLRLELERASALVDDVELQIYTPTPDVPVSLSLAGEHSATLVGKGLQARLPRDRSGALKRVDVSVLSDPVVTTAGITVRARGLLHYAENTEREVAELSLTDTVELDFENGAGFSAGSVDTDGSGRVRVTGDQMIGWLRRGKHVDADGQPTERMGWRMIQLTGAPAKVDLTDLVVSTPKLTVLPGLNGMPFWITASGGISRIEQTGTSKPGTPPIQGSSPRRIHLLRGREHFAANYRAYGFPQWALGPLDSMHVVSFEDDSNLEDEARSIKAASGLHVFQTDSHQRGVISRGFGDVRMLQHATAEREALTAVGNDGFSLIATKDREELDLGPPADRDGGTPWRNHRYEIEHGELHATGTGSCRLEREDEFSVVTMEAPDRDITATMKSRSARLTDVRWLRAEFEGQNIRTFDLTGVPAKATLDRDGETLLATAPRISQTSAASLRMLPSDPDSPEKWHGLDAADDLPSLKRNAAATDTRGRQSLDATAPRIDLHYMGRDHVLVDAQASGDVPARADATIARPGRAPVAVTFEAGRLRALPFAISPSAMSAHLGGRTSMLGSLPFFSERGAWVLGDDVHTVRVEDPEEGLFEGRAHRLVMSAAAEAALLLGDSDKLTPAVATRKTKGRTVTARGAQVRIHRDESVRLQAFRAFPGRSTLLLPEVELHQDAKNDVLSHVRATCRGDIEVLAEAVLFHGPVAAQSITPDGSTLPGGLGIVAESLKMELQPDGKIRRVLGHNVDLDWSRVSGSAAEIDLDVPWNRVTARDPDGVLVTLANGDVVTGEQVTVDYRTLAFKFYRGRVDR